MEENKEIKSLTHMVNNWKASYLSQVDDAGSYKLLEQIKKDYTVNVLLSQAVSKHLLYAMGDIENLLKELFTEMKNQDPSSLPIELKKIKWQDLAIKVFQEYSKIELY